MGDTNPAHFREEMETYRRAAKEEANALKDTHLALERLRTLYQKFDAEERTMAEQVLAEWALSEDENVRFDALALIDDSGYQLQHPCYDFYWNGSHRAAPRARPMRSRR